MLPSILADFVIKVINVVADIIPHHSCCPGFQLEHDVVAVSILAGCVDLGPQEHLARSHVPKVIFLEQLSFLSV